MSFLHALQLVCPNPIYGKVADSAKDVKFLKCIERGITAEKCLESLARSPFIYPVFSEKY